MKYIEGLMDDYTMDRDSAVTLGKFDGLHLGHQQLIRRICEKEKEGLESVVVTIWPNPKNPALLTKGEKKELLKKMGVSWWIDCPFLPEISHMSSEDFVRDILVKRLRAKYIAVGEDFRFGYQRKGDSHLLEQMQKELGYTLEIVPKEMYQGREISSTYVKEALEKAVSLGRPVVLDCQIDRDDKVFPTVPAGAPIEDVFDQDDLKKEK